MNTSIKTLVLSISVACLSSVAMADMNVSVDTDLTSTLSTISKQGTDGSALNLAINTGDVNASVNTAGTGFEFSTHPFETTGSVNQLQGDIKTTAIGAANTGVISLEQGSSMIKSGGAFNGNLTAYLKADKSYMNTEATSGAEEAAAGGHASGGQQAVDNDSTTVGHWYESTSDESSSSNGSISGYENSASNYATSATTAFTAAIDEGMAASVVSSHYAEAAATASNYAAANVAFNSGSIDASVNTSGFTNTLGSIETTAVGAANTGAITVTVK
jgi:hypothetical protein